MSDCKCVECKCSKGDKDVTVEEEISLEVKEGNN